MKDKIAVIGAGMMGSAIIQSLQKGGYKGKITAGHTPLKGRGTFCKRRGCPTGECAVPEHCVPIRTLVAALDLNLEAGRKKRPTQNLSEYRVYDFAAVASRGTGTSTRARAPGHARGRASPRRGAQGPIQQPQQDRPAQGAIACKSGKNQNARIGKQTTDTGRNRTPPRVLLGDGGRTRRRRQPGANPHHRAVVQQTS